MTGTHRLQALVFFFGAGIVSSFAATMSCYAGMKGEDGKLPTPVDCNAWNPDSSHERPGFGTDLCFKKVDGINGGITYGCARKNALERTWLEEGCWENEDNVGILCICRGPNCNTANKSVTPSNVLLFIGVIIVVGIALRG